MDSWMYASPGAGANATENSNASGRSSFDDNNGSATNNTASTRDVPHGDSASPESGRERPKSATSAPRIRRRNRAIQSCLECRRRKLKCDKQAPCSNCTRFRRDCLYLAPALDPSSQQKLSELKEKMGALEKNLEREVAAENKKAHLGGGNVTKLSIDQIKAEFDDDDDEDEVNNEEDALEPTPLAALDQVYEDNVDDELMDLGVQLGKMRISERIGGWIRPKLVEELNDTLQDVKAGKSRHSILPTLNDHRDIRLGAGPKLQASPKSYIGPGPDYIAPASSFFFPGTNMSTSLLDYLPNKNVADQLIGQYWKAVHYMCKCVHRPTFEAQYALFWGQIATGSEPVPSVQAIIFAAMFSATVSMTDGQVMQRFGSSRSSLVDSLRSGTEMALAKANFLRTTKVDTMQAFVMYLIPLVRAEVSRAHSALVGTAIRLAECMGLHRDGLHYNMGPVDVHVRRLVWHQLCFLDMRTCEATGPRPQIRPEDYDTRCPLNVDDMDLLDPHPPTEDKPVWTDVTFHRIRAEIQEMRRQVWFDIMQIDKKKKSITSVLIKIQKFRTAMEEKFLPMVDESIPFQKLIKWLFEIGSKGLHLAVLHRYLFSTTQRMPDRLRQLLIEAGLCQMELSIQFETSAEMQDWSWYRGAFNQYHPALLLMVEVYAYPMRKEAGRIWKCLDYIFEIPPHLAPKQKAEMVLTDLRDRMEAYQQVRKVRASNLMEQRVGGWSKSQYRVPNVVDALGQMQQQHPLAVDATQLPPVHASSPSALYSDSHSNNSGSRQGSVHPNAGGVGTGGGSGIGGVAGGNDVQMSMMDDIDWAEWEKVFHPDVYTGDLNIPDFNMTDFTGSDLTAATTSPINRHAFTATAVAAAASTNDMGMLPHSSQFGGGPAAPETGGGVASAGAFSMPSAAELSEVHFTPALFPTSNWNQVLQAQAQTKRQGGAGGSYGGGGYGQG